MSTRNGILSGRRLFIYTFYFDNTALCEPNEAAFQAWLGAIPNLRRTGVRCTLLWVPLIRNE